MERRRGVVHSARDSVAKAQRRVTRRRVRARGGVGGAREGRSFEQVSIGGRGGSEKSRVQAASQQVKRA